ncbi:MAG: hypothetical protein LH480_07620 [Rubrivivax sp.]|nr:hypothetical protein [Rubrivivax sp.]
MDSIEKASLTLDTQGRVIEQDGQSLFFRLSWVAYLRESWAFPLRLLLCGVVALGLAMVLERYARLPDMSWLTVVGALMAIVWTAYSIALTRSVRLFIDQTGVWQQVGIFPWQKGISGVQWRDLGQAGYTQGFMSWALSSYDVRVSHRFTTGAELYLRNVHRGNVAVEQINGTMARLQGRVMPV